MYSRLGYSPLLSVPVKNSLTFSRLAKLPLRHLVKGIVIELFYHTYHNYNTINTYFAFLQVELFQLVLYYVNLH